MSRPGRRGALAPSAGSDGSTATPSALALHGVSKRYQRGGEIVQILNGVDLTIAPGERVAMIGPSGSGKSTLLHLAGGLAEPDAGTVTVEGRDLASMSTKQRADLRRRHIGFVFQFFHLLPTLSVAENVALPLVLDGDRSAMSKAHGLIERVGLAARRDHVPSELSGGEMQRAAIARALVAGPKLILADEPTGNLDSATGTSVLKVLTEQVRDAGAALLLVTHDRSVARRTDRVVSLRDGVLV